MLKDLEKMMSKKSDSGKLSEHEMQAKMDVLKELLQMAQEAMGSKVKGGMDEMQKVSVMAPDQESLAKGLDLAKDVASSEPALDEAKEEASESPEEMKAESLDPLAEAKEEAAEPADEEDDSIFGKKKKKNTISNMMMHEE